MSILNIGTHCHHPLCPLSTFTPTLCPTCALSFCESHIVLHYTEAHGDEDDISVRERVRLAGDIHKGYETGHGSGSGLRTICEVSNCDRRALEGVAGLSGTGEGEGAGESEGRLMDKSGDIAKRVRCEGCGRAFCAIHRTPQSHACAAPTFEQRRHAQTEARKEQARETITANFPGVARNGKIQAATGNSKASSTGCAVGLGTGMSKREAVLAERRARLAARDQAMLSRSDQGASSSSGPMPLPASDDGSPVSKAESTNTFALEKDKGISAVTTSSFADPVAQIPKSKADKLWEMHIRKVRMAATPLDPKSQTGNSGSFGTGEGRGERRFFEWTVGTGQERKEWMDVDKNKAGAGAGAGASWPGKAKVERAWVPMDMSAGRALDLMVSHSKMARPSTHDDVRLDLFNINTGPSYNRTTSTLQTEGSRGTSLVPSRTLASQVEEGTLVVLVKGWTASAST